jgi:hypothetical protein
MHKIFFKNQLDKYINKADYSILKQRSNSTKSINPLEFQVVKDKKQHSDNEESHI